MVIYAEHAQRILLRPPGLITSRDATVMLDIIIPANWGFPVCQARIKRDVMRWVRQRRGAQLQLYRQDFQCPKYVRVIQTARMMAVVGMEFAVRVGHAGCHRAGLCAHRQKLDSPPAPYAQLLERSHVTLLVTGMSPVQIVYVLAVQTECSLLTVLRTSTAWCTKTRSRPSLPSVIKQILFPTLCTTARSALCASRENTRSTA